MSKLQVLILSIIGVLLYNAGKSQGLRINLGPRRSPFRSGPVDPWLRSFHSHVGPFHDASHTSPFHSASLLQDLWLEDVDELFGLTTDREPFLRDHFQRLGNQLPHALSRQSSNNNCCCKRQQPHRDVDVNERRNFPNQQTPDMHDAQRSPIQETQQPYIRYLDNNYRRNFRDPVRETRDTMPFRNNAVLNFAVIDVTGYAPSDLEVKTEGNQVIVKGRQQSSCDDSCLVTEFQQVFTIPKGIESDSIKARFNRDGKLSLTGMRTNQRAQLAPGRDVGIDYTGHRVRQETEEHGQHKRTGIPLKKVTVNRQDWERMNREHQQGARDNSRTFEHDRMNRGRQPTAWDNTGTLEDDRMNRGHQVAPENPRTFEDGRISRRHHQFARDNLKTFEDERDDDGVTIEVVE